MKAECHTSDFAFSHRSMPYETNMYRTKQIAKTTALTC